MSLLATAGIALDIGERRIDIGPDLAFEPGAVWAVLGANGSGKTSLLHTLAGLRAPRTGCVRLDGRALHEYPRRAIARRLGLLTQTSEDPFPATVYATALSGRHPHLGRWRAEGPDDHARTQQALAEVDLAAMQQRDVTSLSGGERRRLALATLLVQDPAVFLLDEPDSHLDLHYRIRLLTALCERVRAAGGACVMTLHDLDLAARLCDHALLLFDDGTVEHGSAAALLQTDTLSTLYHYPIRRVELDRRPAFVAR